MCAGTLSGGLKASATNKKLYGEDYYKKIGSRGGQRGHTGGFASNPELARAAGAKGGRRSKRTGVTTGAGKKKEYYYTGDGRFANVQKGA